MLHSRAIALSILCFRSGPSWGSIRKFQRKLCLMTPLSSSWACISYSLMHCDKVSPQFPLKSNLRLTVWPKASLNEPRHSLLEGLVGCMCVHRSDCQQEALWAREAQTRLVLVHLERWQGSCQLQKCFTPSWQHRWAVPMMIKNTGAEQNPFTDIPRFQHTIALQCTKWSLSVPVLQSALYALNVEERAHRAYLFSHFWLLRSLFSQTCSGFVFYYDFIYFFNV